MSVDKAHDYDDITSGFNSPFLSICAHAVFFLMSFALTLLGLPFPLLLVLITHMILTVKI
jgi:hypothetical protein